MLRKLIARTMPGCFDVQGHRYGVDNLPAEFGQHLDLAYLAANWRYTAVIEPKLYCYGLAEWPLQDDWWMQRLRAAAAAAAVAPHGGRGCAHGGRGCSGSAPSGPGRGRSGCEPWWAAGCHHQ